MHELFPVGARLVQWLYWSLARHYAIEEHPQYFVHVVNLVMAQAQLYQTLYEWRERGKTALQLAADKVVGESLERLRRQILRWVAQLQKHTEETKVRIEEVVEELQTYHMVLMEVVSEVIPDNEVRERFHRRLAERLEAVAILPGPSGSSAEGSGEGIEAPAGDV